MGMIIRSRDIGSTTVYEVGYLDPLPTEGFVVYIQTEDMDEAEERCAKLNGGMTDYQFDEITRHLGSLCESLIVISDTIARK